MNARLPALTEMEPMQTADLDAVARIECQVYDFPWGRGNFADSLTSGYSCWVCRRSGEVIGYFVVMLALDEAHLLTISVAERHQRKGFGARLLRHAMTIAREGGAKVLLLEVRPSNDKALAMYQHFGFAQIGVRRGYYPAADGREDALVLAHPLAEVSA